MTGHSGDLSVPTKKGWRRTICEDLTLTEKPKSCATLCAELPPKYKRYVSAHILGGVMRRMVSQGIAVSEEADDGTVLYRRADDGN